MKPWFSCWGSKILCELPKWMRFGLLFRHFSGDKWQTLNQGEGKEWVLGLAPSACPSSLRNATPSPCRGWACVSSQLHCRNVLSTPSKPHRTIPFSPFHLVPTQGSSCLQSVYRWVIVVIFKYHQLGRSHQALSTRSGVWDSGNVRACLEGPLLTALLPDIDLLIPDQWTCILLVKVAFLFLF